MEVPENLPLPAKEVERNREDRTDQETPQQAVVDGTCTEHLPGSKGTPEHGTRKLVNGHVKWPVWSTVNLRYLVVEDSHTDDNGDESGEHLAVERDPRWDVGIMSEFETLSEVEVCEVVRYL